MWEIRKKGNNQVMVFPFFCAGDEPKSELARDLGDRLQTRNAPPGASGDSCLVVDDINFQKFSSKARKSLRHIKIISIIL